MANKTVYPFGTGGQLPSSIGIINDLITGGADKALSAEQGKKLGETKPSITIGGATSDLDIVDDDGNVLARFSDGHVQTKEFNSADIQNNYFDKSSPMFYPTAYLPDYENQSPVLFDSLDAIYSAYDTLANAHPQYFGRKSDLGKDASSTYDMRYYQLGWQTPLVTDTRGGYSTSTNQWDDSIFKPTRLIITSGVHPTERPSIYGCYWAIKDILESNEDWALYIRNNLLLDIVPVVNPWGVVNNSSNNANGKNLNRTYSEDVQQENLNMIALITDLRGKGLKGCIDCHNDMDDNYEVDGYLVGKPAYPYWHYYARLAQHLSSLTNELFSQVYGTTKNHFHIWDASALSGQLHEYVNGLGLLGCTFEVRRPTTQSQQAKTAQITKALLINIINSFSIYG